MIAGLDAPRLVADPASSQLAMLASVSDLLETVTTYRSVCEPALRRFARALPARSSALFLVDGENDLHLESFAGDADFAMWNRMEAMGSRALESGRSIQAHRRVPASADIRKGGRSARSDEAMLAVPARLGGRPRGALVLARADAAGFSRGDLDAAKVVAHELALAADHARAERDITESRVENDRLRGQLEAYARDVRVTFAAQKERGRQLAEALSELQATYLATVRGLAVAVEAKDEYTAGHLIRVSRYGMAIMRRVSPELTSDTQLEYGFLLHDVGKMAVPDAVLGKRGPLSEGEWEVMRRHPETGARILEAIPFLAGAREIVFSHHERWDGQGYPLGLRGEETPIPARVFPIADAFDAMTTDRPYRGAMAVDGAMEEIRRGSGTQFWPDAVEAFISLPPAEIEIIRTSSAEWEVPALGAR